MSYAEPVPGGPRPWAGPGCCRAAYESDGHAHDEHTTAQHLTDLAAFVREQRAQGWREAVAALRDPEALKPFIEAYREAEREQGRRPASARVVLADCLESLVVQRNLDSGAANPSLAGETLVGGEAEARE